jgi:hypothetical protein
MSFIAYALDRICAPCSGWETLATANLEKTSHDDVKRNSGSVFFFKRFVQRRMISAGE